MSVAGAGVENSTKVSAGGSATGSGLETQICMIDFRPEVPVATYLALFFLDKRKLCQRI